MYSVYIKKKKSKPSERKRISKFKIKRKNKTFGLSPNSASIERQFARQCA